MYKAAHAVIMAAGTSSRFAPLSYEFPKALITVKGEVLIERQIRQLKEAGINDIYVVTGYKHEDFNYLEDKCGVKLLYNKDYNTRNNNASIYTARDVLANSYVCSADNYFTKNPFTLENEDSYYAAIYANGPTKEWCLEEDEKGYISHVTIGGENAWYMLGHTFWGEEFSKNFLDILDKEYDLPETADKLWEDIYMEHLDVLKMKIKKYPNDFIFEFDSLDELRTFDTSYVNDTRSPIIKSIAKALQVSESAIHQFKTIKSDTNEAIGFIFHVNDQVYHYLYEEKEIKEGE